MAGVARYLADTSALARLQRPAVQAILRPLIDSGRVATCAVVDGEVLWSTRSVREFDEVRSERDAGYEWLPMEDVDGRRAIEVQRELWAAGKPRSVGLRDLLIAAVAERNRVTIVHYDADFDTIADVTGQRAEWVVPRGTVP